MEIRLAFPNEVDAIMQVIEEAKKCLAEAGSTQWQNGYPNLPRQIQNAHTMYQGPFQIPA